MLPGGVSRLSRNSSLLGDSPQFSLLRDFRWILLLAAALKYESATHACLTRIWSLLDRKLQLMMPYIGRL